jgi:hypothetical protein
MKKKEKKRERERERDPKKTTGGFGGQANRELNKQTLQRKFQVQEQ